MPSLISPVLISGPFYHAVIHETTPSQAERDKPYRVQWRRGVLQGQLYGETHPISALSCPQNVENKFKRTTNHFTSVVNDTLVVLVGSMGEIHTNYIVDESDRETRTNGGIDISIERTDVDTGPSKLSKLLGSVDLRAYSPIQNQRRPEGQPRRFRNTAISNREQQTTQRTSPIVAMIAVYMQQ